MKLHVHSILNACLNSCSAKRNKKVFASTIYCCVWGNISERQFGPFFGRKIINYSEYFNNWWSINHDYRLSAMDLFRLYDRIELQQTALHLLYARRFKDCMLFKWGFSNINCTMSTVLEKYSFKYIYKPFNRPWMKCVLEIDDKHYSEHFWLK